MIIFHHGVIHTLHSCQPSASALAIEGEKIFAMGENDEILHLANRKSKIIDLKGKTILPGLFDSHIHLLHYGLKLSSINCETQSKKECLQKVKEKVLHTPPGKWIKGQGWDHNRWEEGIGSKEELDAISTTHPIYLAAKSLHASWVNSQALALARITRSTPNPPGGEIVRDLHGEPNGILLESASTLVEQAIPSPTQEQKKRALQEGQSQLFQYGITAVHDFDEWSIFPLLQSMKSNGEFPLRVVKSIPLPSLEEAIQQGFYSGMGDENLRIGWLKLFMDGALGTQTAAMLQTYEGSHDQFGTLLLSTKELTEIGEAAEQNGIGLAIHAIGDKAVRMVLEGFQQIQSSFPQQKEKIPDRIEHVQIVHPSDIQKMASLHLIASMQPIHLISDMETAEKYWGKRCDHAYAWNSLEKAGIPLIFGSDAPVESPNPFLGIHACLTRQNIQTNQKLSPQQCISLSSALKGYASTPGRIFSAHHPLGEIQAGSPADLIILNENPFALSAASLRDLVPCATMIGGKFVWKDTKFVY